MKNNKEQNKLPIQPSHSPKEDNMACSLPVSAPEFASQGRVLCGFHINKMSNFGTPFLFTLLNTMKYYHVCLFDTM